MRAPIPCGFRQPTQKQVSSPLGILKGCWLTTESSQGGTWTQTAEQKWSGTETLLTVKTETGMVLLLGGSFGPAPNRWGGEQLHPPAPRMLQESCPPSQLLGPLRRGGGDATETALGALQGATSGSRALGHSLNGSESFCFVFQIPWKRHPSFP